MRYGQRIRKFGNPKTRELVVNMSISLLIKGVAMVVSFFSMPLYLRFFDNNIVLGVWYTLLAVLTWVNMFDFGLANGLRNRLVQPIAENNNKRISEYVSSTFFSLAGISLLIFIGGSVLVYLIDMNTIFNVSTSVISGKCMKQVVEILLVGIAVSFVLKTVTSVNYALQLSFINDVNTFLGSAIPLIFILGMSYTSMATEKKLITMACVHVLATWMPPLITFFIVKIKNPLMRAVKISWQFVSKEASKGVSGLGMSFFLVQGVFLVVTQTNEFLISTFFTPDYVVEFRAYNSLFLIIGSIFQVGLSPVWSSVTKASVQCDYVWMEKLKRLLYIVSAMATITELLVVPFSGFIFEKWLGKDVVIADLEFAFIFAIYGSLYVYNVVVTTIANGLGKLKLQTVFYTIGAIVKIPVVYIFSDIFPHYWPIVILINELILLSFCLAQTIWLQSFFKKVKMKNDANDISEMG